MKTAYKVIWQEQVMVGEQQRRVGVAETRDGYIVVAAYCSPMEKSPDWQPRSHPRNNSVDAQEAAMILLHWAVMLAESMRNGREGVR